MFFSDTMVGSVVKYNGALFVACDFDWEKEKYPYLCIVSRNPYYLTGTNYYFTNYEEVEGIISEGMLKDFLPKDIEYTDR